MSGSVRSISIIGLHGRSQLQVEFQDGLNVIHGSNGTGKTTLLHIIANLANGDIRRFFYLQFQSISIESSSGRKLFLMPEKKAEGQDVALILNIDKKGYKLHISAQEYVEISHALVDFFGGRASYFPAFRTILDAIEPSRIPVGNARFAEREIRDSDVEDIERVLSGFRRSKTRRNSREDRISIIKTHRCREWFGPFIPIIQYPSLAEVFRKISTEVNEAQLKLAAADQSAYSTIFARTISSILDEQSSTTPNLEEFFSKVKERIDKLSPGIGITEGYMQIASAIERGDIHDAEKKIRISQVLSIYDDALNKREYAKTEAFMRLRQLQGSINKFFELSDTQKLSKRLEFIEESQPKDNLLFDENVWIQVGEKKEYRYNFLSSGERHIISLLFAATHISDASGPVLIDEPEISLHVDWQRIVLSELKAQSSSRQIIACTHSPEVLADHMDVEVSIEPLAWSLEGGQELSNDDYEESDYLSEEDV